MPTGYTATLVEKGQSFRDFAMDCARAFGACVTMRDDDKDAKIPDKFEPSDYHLKAIAEARALKRRLLLMDAGEQFNYGVKEREKALRSLLDWRDREIAGNARLDVMIREVAAWNPPSDDHVEMRSFMLNQLKISRNNVEYIEARIAEQQPTTGEHIWAEHVAKCDHDIAYHQKEHKEEVQRAKDRTRWVKQLRNSLPR